MQSRAFGELYWSFVLVVIISPDESFLIVGWNLGITLWIFQNSWAKNFIIAICYPVGWFCSKWHPRLPVCDCLTKSYRPGVRALFYSLTFIFMNYGHEWVQDVFIFLSDSVLLSHTEPSLFSQACLTVSLLSTKHPLMQ